MKRLIVPLLMLIVSFASGAQIPKNFSPKQLQISWNLVESNVHADKSTHSQLTFLNTSGETMPSTGWKIYFNYGNVLLIEKTLGNVTIKRINGELFEISPTDKFVPIAPKTSFTVDIFTQSPFMNFTDLPVGFFMKNVADASFVDMPRLKIFPVTKQSLLVRSINDKLPAMTPELIFESNKTIHLLPADQVPLILPTPSKLIVLKDETCLITSQFVVDNKTGFQSEERYLRIKLNDLFVKSKKNTSTQSSIRFVQKQMNSPEGYELSVTKNGVELRASTAKGCFYAIQSLLQLIDPNAYAAKRTSITLPAVEVADEPRFPYRAIHLDVSRNFQSKAQIFKLLDAMALYKMNVFHLHFSDDDGWRIQMPSLPELTDAGSRRGLSDPDIELIPTYGSGADVNNQFGSGFYTTDDFVEILRYATERQIEVIPEIETPGHARAAIKAMENRYRKLMAAGQQPEAEKYRLIHPDDKSVYRSVQSWNDNVIDVSLPSAYAFVERVVDDLAAMYKKADAPLKTIHVGGDEVPAGVWEKSPAYLSLKAQNTAIKSTDDLWFYFFGKVNNILKSRGLILSGWEEVGVRFTQLDGARKMVPNPQFVNEKFQLDVWNNVLGGGAEDLAYCLANAGYKVVLSCVSNNYFDMSVYKAFDEPGYYWGSYVDVDKPFKFIPFDYYKNSTEDLNGNPIDPAVFKGKVRLTDFGKSNILGIKGLLWTETVRSDEMMDYKMYPKLIALAERAWAPSPLWADENNNKHYNEAFNTFANQLGQRELFRLDNVSGGYYYRIPTPGAKIVDATVLANIQTPGFIIRYTTDGTEPTLKSKVYSNPISERGIIKFKAFNTKGRGSLTATIENK